MVCYDYAHHGHSWWSQLVGPSDEWQLISVSGPAACDEICVYSVGGPAVFLVDYIRTGSVFPIVDEVSAAQRSDATKFVDIEYTLEGEGESYLITLQVSDDGGASWGITPSELAQSGDVGDGVVPGEHKHVVWNPMIDIAGTSGENFKVRILAGAEHYADSNVFSIVAAGPGDLMGTVRDQMSGDEIVGADVSVNGEPPVQTDEYGQFFFSEVPAGEATIDVSAAGYYAVTQNVQIREDSFTNVDILLTPDMGFGVVDVRGQYCGPGKHVYYLDGVNLTETLTATIDWGSHTPDYVRWTISTDPGNPIEEACTEDTCSHTFNMGTDFGEGGTLKVTAVAADSTESLPYPVNFKVVAPPLAIPVNALRPNFGGETLTYDVPEGSCPVEPIDEGAAAEDIPDDIPFFSLNDVTLKTTGMFSGSLKGDGTVEGTLSTPDWMMPETQIGLLEFKPEFSGTWAFRFNQQTGVWEHVKSALEISLDAKAETPPYLLWPAPPIYAFGEGGITFGLGLMADYWTGPSQAEYHFTGHVKPWIGGGVGAGLSDLASIEGYVNGGLHFYFVCPPEDSPCWGCLDRFGLWVKAGARAHLLFVEVFDLSSTWTHDFCGGRWDSQKWGEERWTARIMDRDYLGKGHYAVFVANLYDTRGSRDEVTVEIPLQLNVFPWSEPDLAASGDDLLLAWVYDDPNRTPVNRTEVIFSKYDAATELWSEPVAVADDGTADFHPRIAALPNGDAILAWENVSEVLIEPGEPGDPCIDECIGDPNYQECLVDCKLEEAKAKLEIAVSLYDAALGTWTAQTILTSNGHMDRSPRIATASDGTAMLTWVSNAANEEIGDPNYPNDIHYAIYDGVDWSVPADVALDVSSIVKSALAYDGTGAVLLFIGDTDDDQDTLEDRELYAIEYSGGSWGPVLRLTNDTIEDTNPQVAYDATGTPLLVWWSGGEIEAATDLTLTDRHTIVASVNGVTPGKSYLRLARGMDGQLGLVWETASDALIDMWTALYDPVLQAWTKRMLLTSDDSEERSMSCAFDETGDLVVAYNKVETVYETEIIMVGDVEVEAEIADTGEASLYLLRHIISGDLAASDEDVTLDPPNPVAGETATITATVKNLGDVPAVDLDVAFYDGDPGGTGTLIDVTTYGGPLVGGDEVEVSVEWLVPGSVDSHDIYVVVDPDLVQEDRDRNNNTAILPGVMKPDVTIESILVQNAGPADRILTIRALNASGLAVSDVDVTLRRDAEDGELLQAFTITDTIVPGAFFDISWVWEDAAPFPGGSAEVFAIADEADAIDEFDEDNNVRSALVTNQPPAHPGDWDNDNDVDIDDFAEFPACMSGPWGSPGFVIPSQDCLDVFDFDADADVDLKDFAGFQRAFTGGSR